MSAFLRNGAQIYKKFQCSLAVIMTFLQDMVDKGKASSTINVYVAAISCHIGFDGKAVVQHSLICSLGF